MAFKKNVWNQIKNLEPKDLRKALVKDGWKMDGPAHGSKHVYYKGDNMVSIHDHSGKTYGKGMLTDLLGDIGWTEADMLRLKLIK